MVGACDALRMSPVVLLLLTTVFAAVPPPAAGTTAPSEIPTMTLGEALAHARTHERRIRSAMAQLAARREEARVPRSAWLPRVGAAAQILIGTTNNTTASYSSVRGVDLPRIGATPATSTTSWSPHASTLVAASLAQEVYDFGRVAAATAVLDATTEIARTDLEHMRLDVAIDVEEAFYAVLAAAEIGRATDQAHARALSHRDAARAAVDTGLRPPIDLTRAQAEVARLEVRRVRARAGVRDARAVLAASIGAEALEIDAVPMGIEDEASPASDQAFRLAAAENPIIAQSQARVRLHAAERKAFARELAPNLSASATLSGRAGGATPSSGTAPLGDGWLPGIGNWHAGLVLQWSFDAGMLSRRSAAAARERAARAELDLVRAGVGLAVERALVELEAARMTLPASEEALDAARENWAQATARFRSGLGTVVELADAEAVLSEAEMQQAIARFSVARARAELARAVGSDAPPRPTHGGDRP